MSDVTRFVGPNSRDTPTALQEIESGGKVTHWMWYEFPQISGLGSSPTAIEYAIRDLDEAVAFLQHPLLGANYRDLVRAVHDQVTRRGLTINDLFGVPDDHKLVSSLTLFEQAARHLDDTDLASLCRALLDAAVAEGYSPCAHTRARLGIA
ncbi:MAG: DUF1810 domain-containing protein [Ilumatobacteraceae bacterium]